MVFENLKIVLKSINIFCRGVAPNCNYKYCYVLMFKYRNWMSGTHLLCPFILRVALWWCESNISRCRAKFPDAISKTWKQEKYLASAQSSRFDCSARGHGRRFVAIWRIAMPRDEPDFIWALERERCVQPQSSAVKLWQINGAHSHITREKNSDLPRSHTSR